VVELKCPKCGGSDLRRVKGSRYICRSCGYEFYACPVCGEFFEQRWQLASHMRKHRGAEEREILEELRALRELLEGLKALLEEVLAGQKIILAKLDELLEMQRRVLELLSAKPAAAAPPAAEPSDENLPDFLKDNPWLRMLGERAGGE
jgi:predicted RNA-binding Zn-ribbon protein involved in translation (DUF1610 family)